MILPCDWMIQCVGKFESFCPSYTFWIFGENSFLIFLRKYCHNHCNSPNTLWMHYNLPSLSDYYEIMHFWHTFLSLIPVILYTFFEKLVSMIDCSDFSSLLAEYSVWISSSWQLVVKLARSLSIQIYNGWFI